MPWVDRSSSAFACAAGSGDVFTITLSPGYFFSSALASSIAWNTTPPVQPWSAVGTETAIVLFSCACAAAGQEAEDRQADQNTLHVSISRF